MTIFVIGDYHGTSIEDFVEKESPTSDDRIFSLGDFDTIEAINEFLELREKVGPENVVEVGGNHDKALLEEKRVTSRTSKTASELVAELKENPRAREYLEEITEEPYAEFEIADRKGVLTHSGLTGLIRNPDIAEDMRPFVYRVWDEDHFHDNFDLMEDKGYEFMIRGHEHYTEHAMRDREQEDLAFNLPEPGSSYELDSEYLHILTNGAIMDGHYMEIDEQEMTATFQQL